MPGIRQVGKHRHALILMAGMPGSGKSTVALALGAEFGMPVIDKDVIVSTLLDAGIDEPVAQPASYAVMFALGREVLRQRGIVILDSPAGLAISVEAARTVANDADAELVCVLCLADRDIRNARVAARISMRSQPVRESRTAGDGRERSAHLPPDTIVVTTEDDVETCAATVLAALRARPVTS